MKRPAPRPEPRPDPPAQEARCQCRECRQLDQRWPRDGFQLGLPL